MSFIDAGVFCCLGKVNMPYKLSKRKDGYVVVNSDTGEDKNKKPMPRSRAVAYLRALYAAESGAKMGKKSLVDEIKATFKRMFDKNTGGGVDRDKLAASDFVDPERRRFPIVTPADVKDAVASYGRAKPPIPFDEFKRKVIAICKRKGEAFMAQLPANWKEDEAKKELPTLFVFKQSDGHSRWVTFSSNAYRDRDKEIVSTAALEADVARADKEGDYGPLRWWHVGQPDPFAKLPGPGADIGRCDYNAMHGRILVESGTFENERIAEAVKSADLQVSIGFFHPRTEPVDGVFHTIRRFERSLLPRGRASNPWTSMLVVQKEGGTMLKEKIQALKALLGGDDELVQAVLAKAEQTEKAADEAGIEFKGEDPQPAEPIVAEVKAEEEAKGETTEVEEPEEDAEMENVIGDMTPEEFSGMMAEALSKALEPYTKELKALKTAQSKKDDEAAAMREAMELQASTITALKSRLDELEGSQPRAANKGYRASQAEETVVKDNSPVKGARPTVDPDFFKFAFGNDQ